ncbi:MAG: type II toxin-antitoxin system VapB family antitoxin [Actinobacteria bacterium]|nr:type II toxin-antitoxin system VapB family antitoxin [Actinomycetota bacterium]
MKTTLNLDDALLRAAKKMAAERGVTLTQVIEEALRAAVTEPRDRRGPFRLQWATVKGRRPPDVDIADRDALYDRMEARP